jgi:hypothetical protein
VFVVSGSEFGSGCGGGMGILHLAVVFELEIEIETETRTATQSLTVHFSSNVFALFGERAYPETAFCTIMSLGYFSMYGQTFD